MSDSPSKIESLIVNSRNPSGKGFLHFPHQHRFFPKSFFVFPEVPLMGYLNSHDAIRGSTFFLITELLRYIQKYKVQAEV